MKFVLTYDGPLSSQNSRGIFEKKWEIRQQLHPQLQALWRTHRCLASLVRFIPRKVYGWLEVHHSSGQSVSKVPDNIEQIDLGGPIVVGGVNFLPLVRDSYALTCTLKFKFMRMEPVGGIYQGGDIDNRIKTFLDALKVPKSEADRVEAMADKPAEPIYCLLEDDSLITGLTIETARLLASPDQSPNYTRLIVDVDVRVSEPHMYNSLFLGD